MKCHMEDLNELVDLVLSGKGARKEQTEPKPEEKEKPPAKPEAK